MCVIEKHVLGIIGGTGVYEPSWLTSAREVRFTTPWGEVAMVEGQMAENVRVCFLNRHGGGHRLPPHRVNYRGNLWALRAAGVERVVATQAVGSLNTAMEPGKMVLCDQFMDFTKSRVQTFFEGGEDGVVHTDMTAPYCAQMRAILNRVGTSAQLAIASRGTYVATEGPRFETPAEIRAYRLLGGDVVGMTGVPEVVLARELGLCYASVALVTNFAAGISERPLTHAEVLEVMAANTQAIKTLIMAAVPDLAEPKHCKCSDGGQAPLNQEK